MRTYAACNLRIAINGAQNLLPGSRSDAANKR
jgi:hypothetical protein